MLENCTSRVDCDGSKVDVEFQDTATENTLHRLISPSCQKADAVLVCFAVNDRGSFEDVQEKVNCRTWYY